MIRRLLFTASMRIVLYRIGIALFGCETEITFVGEEKEGCDEYNTYRRASNIFRSYILDFIPHAIISRRCYGINYKV